MECALQFVLEMFHAACVSAMRSRKLHTCVPWSDALVPCSGAFLNQKQISLNDSRFSDETFRALFLIAMQFACPGIGWGGVVPFGVSHFPTLGNLFIGIGFSDALMWVYSPVS